jgi:hypothetical protein
MVTPFRPFPERVTCPDIVYWTAAGLAVKVAVLTAAVRGAMVWLGGLKVYPLSEGVTV